MLKFLLILALSLYVLSKIGSFLARAGSSQQYRQTRPGGEGKIHVDTPPKPQKNKDFKGGEYVDYEEVK